MRILRGTIILLVVVVVSGRGSDDILDRLSDTLTTSTHDGQIAARISGSLDLEGYSIPHPAPGLIYTPGHSLFNPRLSLFLDAQIGTRCYLFSQARVDRGFDPGDGDVRARLDEYALRVAVRNDGLLNLQVGRFATVVGRWIQRHGSWDNPFITAPLAYENLTGIWDSAAARSADTLLGWAHVRPGANVPADEYVDKHLRAPIIWGPSYASGVAVSGEMAQFDYAIEAKNAALSSRPDAWTFSRASWRHPSYSARMGYRPNVMWNLGLSANTGAYLLPTAALTVAPGYTLDHYRQTVLGHDVSFAWRHWQAWAEVMHARFEVPRVGNVDTVATFAEVKCKLTPQLSGALRVNRQTFSDLTDSKGRRAPWGRDLWRLDVAPSYRFTPHLQVKAQYSYQREDGIVAKSSHIVAAQTTLRF